MGTGEGSPLYDPGSKLYYWEGESNASITRNEMGKRKEVKRITAAAVIIRYPSKCQRSTRSGIMQLVRTTSSITRSGHGQSSYWRWMLD